MIAVYELTLTSPALAGVLVGIAALVAGGCHVHRDIARERHRDRRENGLGARNAERVR